MKLNRSAELHRARQLLAECLKRSGVVLDEELGA